MPFNQTSAESSAIERTRVGSDSATEDSRKPVVTAGVIEKLLAIPEVKERLAIGRTKVLELIEEGRLQKVKIGRRALVTRSSVDRYIVEIIEEARAKERGL